MQCISSFARRADGGLATNRHLRRDVKRIGMSCNSVDTKLDDIARHLAGRELSLAKKIAGLKDQVLQVPDPDGWETEPEDDRDTGVGGIQGSAKEDMWTAERDVLVSHIWSSDWQLGLDDHVAPCPWIDKAILESLFFKTMNERESAVSEASQSTFKWIFHREAENGGFPEWLETEKDTIFWVTGKPGSGKSTLMKYILTSDHDLRKSLGKWSGSLTPTWAGYYFWDAGSSSLQRSREGMMRTLLHQCLVKQPSLIPIAAQRRYGIYSALGNSRFTAPPWDWVELTESFALVASQSGKTFRLALFIDGLDEFDGDPDDIISLIKSLSSTYDVKICVSSRPWSVFSDALARSPSLTMQTLTHSDILAYIDDKLGSCRAFKEREVASPDDTRAIVNDVAKGAEGVFLWVSVVVRSLVRLFTHGKSIKEIQNFLGSLTPNMSDLFTKIWLSIEPEMLETASRLFQLKMATLNIITLDACLLWVAEGETLPRGVSKGSIERIRPVLSRKLDTHTRGILEISATGDIDFLHRSAKDWITEPEVWEVVSSATPSTYDASLALLKAANICVIPQVTKYRRSNRLRLDEINPIFAIAGNVADKPELVPQLVKSLDKMNSILCKKSQHDHKTWKGHCDKPTCYIAWGSVPCNPRGAIDIASLSFKNCFVGYAACHAILPYVRAKVSTCPSLLGRRSDEEVSLLENAVYGSSAAQIVVSQGRLGEGRHGARSLKGPQRIQLVKYLAEAGDSPLRTPFDGTDLREAFGERGEEMEKLLNIAGGVGNVKPQHSRVVAAWRKLAKRW